MPSLGVLSHSWGGVLLSVLPFALLLSCLDFKKSSRLRKAEKLKKVKRNEKSKLSVSESHVRNERITAIIKLNTKKSTSSQERKHTFLFY